MRAGRLSFVLMLVAVLALLLAACGQSSPQTNNAGSATESAQEEPAATEQTEAAEEEAAEEVEPTEEPEATAESEPAAAGEPVEIEFWTLLTGALGERLDAQVQAFNASQNEVRVVNVFQGGYDELNQKLLASVAGGNPPPVTMIDYILVPFYAQQGVFLPLKEVATQEDLDEYLPSLLTDLSYQGDVYGLPYNRSTQGLYYNKELFEEVGLDPEDPPSTWEEYREYATKITEAEGNKAGGYATFQRWYFEPFLGQWGGQMNDAECNPTFQESAGVEMMSFFQGLHHEDEVVVMPANLSGGFDQQAIEFITGQVGMLLQSTAIQGFIGDTVDFPWGFTMLPEGPEGRVVTHGGGNLAITTSATPEQREAAWKFLDWITSPEQSGEFHMATGYMPSSEAVLDLEAVQTFHKEHPSWLTSVEQLEFARPTSCLVVNTGGLYVEVITEAIERILINNEEPEATLAQAAEELQTEIDRRRTAGELIEVK